jgi:Raf kinase inhibitor-like YbhB/YbcL family protein
MVDETSSQFRVMSPAFADGTPIPQQYTCKGQNINPPINILNVPSAAVGVTLIMHDPDAISGDFVHWLMWDIPRGIVSISVNNVPLGAVQGLNSRGETSYTGPCPPPGSGTHRYMFDFFAVDKILGLDPSSDRQKVELGMQRHIVDRFTLTGLFSADPT